MYHFILYIHVLCELNYTIVYITRGAYEHHIAEESYYFTCSTHLLHMHNCRMAEKLTAWLAVVVWSKLCRIVFSLIMMHHCLIATTLQKVIAKDDSI